MADLTASPRAIPERPALSPWFRLLPGDDRLLLEHGGTVVTFDGKAAGLLLPSLLSLLDGTRTVPDIVDSLGTAIAPATRHALELLNEKGALFDGPQPAHDGSSANDAAIFAASLAGTAPAEALATLVRARVAVGGAGPAAGEIARILAAAGIRSVRAVDLEEAFDDNELLIAAPGYDELEALHVVNERRLELDAPWLQVLPNDGRIIAVGPVFLPGTTGCHRCYRLRRAACSGFEDDFDGIAAVPPRAGSPAPLTVIAAGIAGVLALRWLALADPTLPGRFYTLHTGVVLGLDYHRLLRVPRCPDCGAGGTPMPSPWFDQKACDA